MRYYRIIPVLVLLMVSSISSQGTASSVAGQDNVDVSAASVNQAAALGPLPAKAPELPFADNPDPNQCGIPVPWISKDPAWVTGYYDGTLVQPVVYLYDSHLRREVVGQIPSGGRIQIMLSQTNPELNYFHVRSLDLTPVQEGWVPAPFVTFEPVS